MPKTSPTEPKASPPVTQTQSSSSPFNFDEPDVNESPNHAANPSDEANSLRTNNRSARLHRTDAARIRAFRQNTGVTLGILYAIMIIVCIIAENVEQKKSWAVANYVGAFFFYGFIGILGCLLGRYVICAIYVRGAYAKQCPSCARLWAKNHEKSVLIGQREGYETVTRDDIHRNTEGKKVGHTQRQEQVHMVYQTHLNHYKCSFCRHRWTDISRTEFEG